MQSIFADNCTRCHGGVKAKGGLDLRSPASILAGAESGAVVVPGEPDASLLATVLPANAKPHMPPGKGKQLAEEEIDLVRRWITALAPGAADGALELRTDPPRPPALPPGLTPRLVIDLLIERGWIERDVRPSPPASDRVFARRLFLDLAGRLPTREELEAFLAETRSDKRERLVDQILASPDYAGQMRDLFDAALTRRQGRNDGWRRYLEWAFATNRPWIDIAEDMIVARPEEHEARAASWFLYRHRNKHQQMAENLAPALLGVQIQCAQCHDHPIAPEIEQRHYWGLVSFLNRSKNVDTKRGQELEESAVGGFISFALLDGGSANAEPVFLNGKALEEKRPGKDEKEKDSPEKYLVPRQGGKPERAAVPRVSRRARFFELSVRDEPRLAKAFVNRLWAHLLGRGLVHPVDKIDSSHPPSHPELFDWLGADFRTSGYDVKRLVREIVLSRVYQLDAAPAADASPVPPDAFAHAIVRPLTGETLARAIAGALELRRGDRFELEPGDRDAIVRAFPELFVEDYSATLKQSLFVSNNAGFDALLDPERSALAARLLAHEPSSERVRIAFAAIFHRVPDTSEFERSTAYLEARGDRPAAAMAQLLWALLASAEFRFNH